MYLNVGIDDDDVLSELTDQQIKDEFEDRGLELDSEEEEKREPINREYESDKKRFLCDLVGVGYYSSVEEIMNELRKAINE